MLEMVKTGAGWVQRQVNNADQYLAHYSGTTQSARDYVIPATIGFVTSGGIGAVPVTIIYVVTGVSTNWLMNRLVDDSKFGRAIKCGANIASAVATGGIINGLSAVTLSNAGKIAVTYLVSQVSQRATAEVFHQAGINKDGPCSQIAQTLVEAGTTYAVGSALREPAKTETPARQSKPEKQKAPAPTRGARLVYDCTEYCERSSYSISQAQCRQFHLAQGAQTCDIPKKICTVNTKKSHFQEQYTPKGKQAIQDASIRSCIVDNHNCPAIHKLDATDEQMYKTTVREYPDCFKEDNGAIDELLSPSGDINGVTYECRRPKWDCCVASMDAVNHESREIEFCCRVTERKYVCTLSSENCENEAFFRCIHDKVASQLRDSTLPLRDGTVGFDHYPEKEEVAEAVKREFRECFPDKTVSAVATILKRDDG